MSGRLSARLHDRVLAAAPAHPRGSSETVVTSCAFCCAADPEKTASSIRDRLPPGGQLVFVEHVRAAGLRGRVQHALSPLWARPAAGCRLDRDTVHMLRRAGFVVTDCERSVLPGIYGLLGDVVLGRARRRSPGRAGVVP